MNILRFVWMLIGSEITYGDALSILYEVHVKGNHADGDKVLQKKWCHEITPAAAKARSLRCFAIRRGRTMKCKPTGILH